MYEKWFRMISLGTHRFFSFFFFFCFSFLSDSHNTLCDGFVSYATLGPPLLILNICAAPLLPLLPPPHVLLCCYSTVFCCWFHFSLSFFVLFLLCFISSQQVLGSRFYFMWLKCVSGSIWSQIFNVIAFLIFVLPSLFLLAAGWKQFSHQVTILCRIIFYVSKPKRRPTVSNW